MITTYINGKAHIIDGTNDILALIREHMGNTFAEDIRDYITDEWEKIYAFDDIMDILTAPNGKVTYDLTSEEKESTMTDILNVVYDYDEYIGRFHS